MRQWLLLVLPLLLLSACVGVGLPDEPADLTEPMDWDAVDLAAVVDDYIDAYIRSDLVTYTWWGYSGFSRWEFIRFTGERMQQQQKAAPYYDRDSQQYLIPSDVFEAEAARYFDLPEGGLRGGIAPYYSPDTDCYTVYPTSGGNYWKTAANVQVATEGDRVTVSFDQLDRDGTHTASNTLYLAMGDDALKLLGGDWVRKDFVPLCVTLNVRGIDLPFGHPDQLSDPVKFAYAWTIIDTERLHCDRWDDWSGGDYYFDRPSAVPRAAVEEALALRLGEVSFDPTAIDLYDAERDVFDFAIGGYGGWRSWTVRSNTVSGSLHTIVIDYTDDYAAYPDYETRTYVFDVDEDWDWKLVAIYEGEPVPA